MFLKYKINKIIPFVYFVSTLLLFIQYFPKFLSAIQRSSKSKYTQ
jgi:hypothetical protein